MTDSIREFPIKEMKNEPEDDEVTAKIFSRFDFEQENPSKESRIDEIREILIKHMLTKRILPIYVTLFVLIAVLAGLELAGIYLTFLSMTCVFLIYYPQIKEKNSYANLNRELPYALRHMGIELKSGKGLHDTLQTIRNANYGVLSEEFNRVLEEVKYGKPTEESLLEMSHRVKSEGLKRTIHQIIGTLRVGGNLANSLDVIAQDISFETRIKLKEYSQKLNSFILIYTFIAILAPVVILIMAMAGSTVMGDLISGNLLLIIYSLFFPLIVMFMGLLIKKLEPNI